MDDLELFPRRPGRLSRGARSAIALFGSGFVTGMALALLFSTLVRTIIIAAAVVIVLVALARAALGGRRPF
ncbi:MAG: hypothetical protein IRZ02_08070 [Acidothermus sp.]|nr:hypothetical protein [Acidothermus sp.]MCL6538338.1 hypothetical protein [Acidothermus sp.]